MKKEILITGIICLFIGVGIQPAFAVDISKDKTSNSDLVEITLQLCKTSGVEDHKMYITQEQDEQLDVLIDNFKAELDNAVIREETIRIYKDMVISLDELGILPEDLSCEDAQQLVTGENSISNPEKIKYEKLKNKNPEIFDNTNLFCLISGETTNTATIDLVTIGSAILGFSLLIAGRVIYEIFENNNLSNLGLLIFWIFTFPALFLFIASFLSYFLPLKLGGFMFIGKSDLFDPRNPFYYPAQGWVHTIGLNGIKTWDGSFYGNILASLGFSFYYTRYLGAIGFTGIKILPFGSSFYLGSALLVNISPNP